MYHVSKDEELKLLVVYTQLLEPSGNPIIIGIRRVGSYLL